MAESDGVMVLTGVLVGTDLVSTEHSSVPVIRLV